MNSWIIAYFIPSYVCFYFVSINENIYLYVVPHKIYHLLKKIIICHQYKFTSKSQTNVHRRTIDFTQLTLSPRTASERRKYSIDDTNTRVCPVNI